MSPTIRICGAGWSTAHSARICHVSNIYNNFNRSINYYKLCSAYNPINPKPKRKVSVTLKHLTVPIHVGIWQLSSPGVIWRMVLSALTLCSTRVLMANAGTEYNQMCFKCHIRPTKRLIRPAQAYRNGLYYDPLNIIIIAYIAKVLLILIHPCIHSCVHLAGVQEKSDISKKK